MVFFMDTEHLVSERFKRLRPHLGESQVRLLAAAEASVLGRGGVTTVSRATGLSRTTVTAGCAELAGAPVQAAAERPATRQRRAGGGRKALTAKHPRLKDDLETLVEPVTRGDPDSPLRWTCKSTRVLARELGSMGYRVSHVTVAALLEELEYSLQANRKTREGTSHPDRDAQFSHISETVRRFQCKGQPVISVDTKKKELIGNFKNGGREWRPKGCPEPVRVHDFMIPALGKATPYGVYDLARNEGWVNVGTDHDTAAFAVESIRRWWSAMGCEAYPRARRLLVTADSGGSNGARIRLWKTELQRLADETGLAISVCHFPPGTSKWNKIEHRMFAHISMNWRGKPLVSHEVLLQLIAATTTTRGLKVRCALDTNTYPKGVKVPPALLKEVRLTLRRFHGDWNYTIRPNRGP
jgi:hypothetical protein